MTETAVNALVNVTFAVVSAPNSAGCMQCVVKGRVACFLEEESKSFIDKTLYMTEEPYKNGFNLLPVS